MGILSRIAGVVWSEAKPDRFYADITFPNRQKKRHLVHISGGSFLVNKRKFYVDLKDEDCITFVGFWRVPSADYLWSHRRPLKRVPAVAAEKTPATLTPIGDDDGVSPEDAYSAETDAVVVSQTLRSFMPEMLSQTTSFFLLMIGVVAGPIILYVVFNNKFRDVITLLTQVAAAHGIKTGAAQ